MSKADEALSTSACPAPTRRVFLCQTGCMAGAAITASGATQMAHSATQPTPLFREYLEACHARDEAYGTVAVRTHTDAGRALQDKVEDRVVGAVKAIKARRPSTLQELLELARVARNEASSDDWDFDRQYVYEFEESLTLGILALADGGAHG